MTILCKLITCILQNVLHMPWYHCILVISSWWTASSRFRSMYLDFILYYCSENWLCITIVRGVNSLQCLQQLCCCLLILMLSRDGCSALPRGATGCCGISWSYSLTIFSPKLDSSTKSGQAFSNLQVTMATGSAEVNLLSDISTLCKLAGSFLNPMVMRFPPAICDFIFDNIPSCGSNLMKKHFQSTTDSVASSTCLSFNWTRVWYTSHNLTLFRVWSSFFPEVASSELSWYELSTCCSW